MQKHRENLPAVPQIATVKMKVMLVMKTSAETMEELIGMATAQ